MKSLIQECIKIDENNIEVCINEKKEFKTDSKTKFYGQEETKDNINSKWEVESNNSSSNFKLRSWW